MPLPTLDKKPNLFVATLARSLALGGSETEIFISTLKTYDGQDVSTSDFSYFGVGRIMVDVQSASRAECISFTGTNLSSKKLTGAIRGLSSKDSTVIPANKKFHAVGAPVVIAWGTQDITEFETIINNNYTALLALIQSAVISGAIPASTTAMGITRLAEDKSVVLGNPTITIASPAVVTLANHGLTVNDIVVFTTTGALPTGIIAGQSYYVLSTGLTANDFEISLTPAGTPINTSGTQSGIHTLTKTTPVALAGDLNTNEALDGTSGTPSLTNKFETENDTANGATETATTISFTASTKTIADSGNGFITANFRAGDTVVVSGSASNNGNYTIVSVSAGAIVVSETLVDEVAGATVTITSYLVNKLLRMTIAGVIPAAILKQSQISAKTVKFGGTGADGALVITAGATNINLGGAAFFEKNYTSISITGTGQLTFTNPHANGTVIILKSQGNVVLTSSTLPNIDASALGANDGAGAADNVQNNAAVAGTDGTDGVDIDKEAFDALTHLGAKGIKSGGGASAAGVAFGSLFPAFLLTSVTNLARKYVLLKPGAGGGGGASGDVVSGSGASTTHSGAAGRGGRGGGALYIECGGSLNFTSILGISVAGENGVNATSASNVGTGANDTRAGGSGGGGGGAGGMCVILYNSVTANTGTINIKGGNGGNGGNGFAGARVGGGTSTSGGAGAGAGSLNDGGNGGDGVAGNTPGNSGSAGSGATGGTGGTGGTAGFTAPDLAAGGGSGGGGGGEGKSLVTLNTEFA